MQIKTKITILKAESRQFADKQTGKQVNYNTATIMLEGKDLMEIGVDTALITSLVGVQNKEGEGTIEITSGFKNKAKLQLTTFK